MNVLLLCIAGCLAVLLQGATCKIATLPPEFKMCKRGDDICMLDAVRVAIPILVRGVPKFRLAPIDPMYVEAMELDHGAGPVQIQLALRQQNISGLADSTVTAVRSEMREDSFMIEVKLEMPSINVLGDYEIAGKILVLPIRGRGKNNFNFVDVLATCTMQGHMERRDGQDFLQLDDFRFDFTTSRLYLNLENLFNGNRALGDNMVAFLNENWHLLVEELRPALVEGVGQVLGRIPTTIFSQVPYAMLFTRE